MRNNSSWTGCILCDEVRNEEALSSRLNIYKWPNEKIIIETNNFMVIPDISPIIPGHSLILPKEHYTSVAKFPPLILEEFQEVKKEAVSLVSKNYSMPFLFEHGSSIDEGGSGACIDHAHIHLLPLRSEIDGNLEEFGKVEALENIFFNMGNLGGDLRNYLCYENQDSMGFLVRELYRPVPSQFIRRVIAERLGIFDWNWKKIYFKNAIAKC